MAACLPIQWRVLGIAMGGGVVGKLSPQANWYRAPPARRPGQTGRPRLKGDKLPSPQQWLAQVRTTLCPFELFSIVALMFAELYCKHPAPARAGPGDAKPEPTFTDALAAVRRELGSGFLKPPAISRPWQKPPPPIIDTLLDCLCYAA